MKKLLSISFIALMLQSCSTQNPNPNSNGNNTTALPSVTICNQVWMTKNLDVSTYRNGDIIPQVTDPTQWQNSRTGAWCWYNNDSVNYSQYGKLYNSYAVNDPRGLAPTGWHVPSDSDWAVLENCLGGSNLAGGKMKESSTSHWLSPNIGATNSSGFTGLPGGFRGDNGSFLYFYYYGYWWSSTGNLGTANAYNLYYGNTNLEKRGYIRAFGLSVRLLKD